MPDGDRVRRIYSFAELTEFERNRISEVKNWIEENELEALPSGYLDEQHMILRYTAIGGSNHSRTYELVQMHEQWLEEELIPAL